ncbi:MAG: hypothetical protein JWQ87_4226 [Candidatus Sulfotelmatobacter sp.]|nr:hypothetical protein [Candidatus Sulfotelmatobacter sp.]
MLPQPYGTANRAGNPSNIVTDSVFLGLPNDPSQLVARFRVRMREDWFCRTITSGMVFDALTITPQNFPELLAQSEGPGIDFKRDPYDLGDEEGRGAVIKDILSMANTPRTGPAYIVLGVKAHTDGTKDLVGLSRNVDDNEYQNAVKSKVYPCPTFLYVPVQYDQQFFGVLVIPAERRGPFQAINDVGKKVRRYVIYWRRGSQNDEARQDEQEAIRRWCAGEVRRPIEIPSSPQTPWEKFLAGAHSFEPERIYILLAGPVATNSASRLSGLASAPWNFVIDFDPNSASSGLGSTVQPPLRQKRALREIVMGDRPTIRVERTCYWYYARGVASRVGTMCESGWRAWKQKYGRDLVEQLKGLAQNRNSRPATIIALWDSEDYVDTVFSAALDVFGEAVDFVVANEESHRLVRFVDRFGSVLVQIEPEHLGEALHSLYASESDIGSEALQLPTKSGTRTTVMAEDRRYLEEELEIVGLSAGTLADENRESCLAFFKGKQITWFELGLHCDVDRERTDRIMKTVLQDLGGGEERRSKGTTRINIYHAPGAGGSTVARRIAWSVHLEFPTVVLRKCVPAETAARLELIYRLTSLPILLLIEGADVQERQAEDLYSILRARQVSVVFLQVLRRFSRVEERERAFFIDSQLSPVESSRFAHRLSEARPQRRSKLLALASKGTESERTAFYFALEAFEEHFEGLQRYVGARIERTTEEQKTIVLFLAIAYHYGQQAVASSAFGDLLGIPKTRKVDLDRVLPDFLRDLLRCGRGENWRTAHDLIAAELIHQVLAPDLRDPRIWRQNLSVWGIRFADFCRGRSPIPSSDMLELASRCFVLRDDRDPLGRETSEEHNNGKFSHLIGDIPSMEGRLTVLIHLTELFPEEAHFWGHLGRFYSVEMRDTENALHALDRAIAISPEDDVLYHMKGMALRSQLYDSMQSNEVSKQTLDNALVLARQAAEQFAIARTKEPSDEHGYISHIQMLLRLLEYAKRAIGAQSEQQVLVSPTVNATLRESLDIAEDLLEQARRLREGERPSFHVQRCRVQMDALYGKFDIVLQGWNNLLTRPDVYRPPIRRQLVQAYVVRKNRRWDQLDAHEVTRIVELLDQNLLEEPNDRRNLRLWMQAVRRVQPPVALDQVIERISYWKANSPEIDPVYYVYVLYALKAMDGYVLAFDALKENLEECRRRARLRPNRTGSFEWIGPGQGLRSLIHYTELGEWSNERDFWEGAGRLFRMKGVIASISGPEAGLLEVAGGVKAFFVPGKSGHSRGRDENRTVECFLGFSYDGPRAWEVRNV